MAKNKQKNTEKKLTKEQQEIEENALKKKFFPLNLAKYILFIVPIVYIIYLYSITASKGEKFYQPVLDDPKITVMFVLAMLAFFCGTILKYVIRDLEEGKNVTSNKISLNIIALAQLATGNIIASGIIWGGLYRIRKDKGAKINSVEFKEDLKHGLVNIIGAIIILLLVLLCVYFMSKVYSLSSVLPY